MFSLKDQVAIVTGGAKGIGKGIATVLAKAGAQVVIADIDVEAGQSAAEQLGATFVTLDVTDKAACQTVVDSVLERYGRLDILCSNTGIFPQAALDVMTTENWDQLMDVNLRSTFFMVQAVLPSMRQRGYGRIVITSSITGAVTGYPGWAHYAASKAGQLGFMRSAALECAREGITINAVMPGNIRTAGLEAQGEAYLKEMADSIPVKKLGEPEDIGHAACFLASPEARFITGQTIIVDGGQILPESFDAIL